MREYFQEGPGKAPSPGSRIHAQEGSELHVRGFSTRSSRRRFRFRRPVSGLYFWCPPMLADRLDLWSLGLRETGAVSRQRLSFEIDLFSFLYYSLWYQRYGLLFECTSNGFVQDSDIGIPFTSL